MQTPLDKLRALYERQSPHRSLEDDIGWHILNGYCIVTPSYIIMGKAIEKDTKDELISDVTFVFDPQEWNINCWYVFAYAGTWRNFLTAVPYYLPFIAFHRRNAIRYYNTYAFTARHSQLRKTHVTMFGAQHR